MFRCINLPAFDHKSDCLAMYSASAMLVMLYAINSVMDREWSDWEAWQFGCSLFKFIPPPGGGGLLPYMGYIGTDTAFMIGDAYLMLYPSRGLFHGNVKLDIGF